MVLLEFFVRYYLKLVTDPKCYILSRYINKLLTFSIIIFSVFYNFGASIFLFFQKSPFIINFFSKLSGFFCCLLIITSLYNHKTIKINKYSLPILFFLFLYSIRLAYDAFFLNLKSAYPNLLIFSYFFGGIVFISLAIIIARKYLNIRYIFKFFIITLCLSNLAIFILLIRTSQFNILTIFSQRLSFGIEDIDSYDIINSITISVNASLLLLYFTFSSIFKITFLRFNKHISLILILLSILNLILSGSRGPLISMLFIILLMLIQAKKIKLKNIFRFIFILTLIIFFFLRFTSINFNEISYLQRIYSNDEFTLLKDDSRKELYNSAISQFYINPIIGDKYFEETTKTYPHNILIEVLMSTGLIGIVLFLIHCFVLLFLYLKYYIYKDEKTFIFYVTFFYFFCSLFSSSIWGNLEFFIFSILLIYTLKNKLNTVE
jgi:hypothetical protein